MDASNPASLPPDTPRLAQIYTRTAAFYDDVVAVHQARAKELALSLLDRRAGEWFVEAGVGTGWAFGREVGRRGGARAAGVEVAAGMLDVARGRLDEVLGGAAYDLMLGDARGLPVRDGAIDCLLNTYTLECMTAADIEAALLEFRRVLRPGGRIVVADLTEGEGDDASMTEDWKRGYAADPEYYGGARPIRLVPLLEAARFGRIERLYSGHGDGWPSEVVRAFRR